MAVFVNDGNINWNGNWQTTNKVDALHATTNISCGTGGAVSTTWNGNASNTNRGALIYITAVNTCTLTVTLQEYAASTWNNRASTTLSVTSSTRILSWYYFKFSSTHTETAGTANYRIEVKTSTSTVSCRANNAATSNVGAVQVLDATGTLVAGSDVYICGITQASSVNPTTATVTMNINDSSTIFGGIWINNEGKLSYGTSAGTTYYLRQAGAIGITGTLRTLQIDNGGYFEMGTAATPIPADSTATFEIAANGASRIAEMMNGCFCYLQGYPKFATPTNFRCNTTDAIAVVGDRTVSTSINPSTEGWAANDQVMISTTAANGSAQTEIKTISSVSSNSITITTDWSYTHLAGAELCNLTRNVVFKGSGASSSYEIRLNNIGTTVNRIDFDYVRFEGLRSNTNYYGCVGVTYSSGSYRWTIDNVVFYDLYGSTTGRPALLLNGDTSISNSVWWMNYNGTYAVYGLSYSTHGQTTFTDCSIGGLGVYGFVHYTIGSVKLTRVHIYDKINNTSAGYGLVAGAGGEWILEYCKIWGLRCTGTSSRAIECGQTQNLRAYHCIFGNDGTNNSDNYYDLINYYSGNCFLYNCKTLSAVPLSYQTSYFLSLIHI